MNKVYVYDLCQGKYTYQFDSLDETIEFLANRTRVLYNGKLSNDFLDNINMNFNDKFYLDVENKYFTRRYLFVDSDNRIIDMREYQEEIYKIFLDISDKKHNKFEPKYGDKLIRHGITYRYRIDPVPDTSVRLHKFHGLRHPKTTQEKRLLCDADISTYIRGKRKHLPSAYDDLWRSDISDKSWKRQKIKRQYMKHNHPLV